MRSLFLATINIICFFVIHGQSNSSKNPNSRMPLDINNTRIWPSISGGSLSNNGEFLFYYISNQPAGSITLFLKSTNQNWERSIPFCSSAYFTPDSKYLVYKLGSDSLFLQKLGTEYVSFIGLASNFKVFGDYKTAWLAFLNKTMGGSFKLFNLTEGKNFEMHSVNDYIFSTDYKSILIAMDSLKNGITIHSLQWIRLIDFSSHEIWQSKELLPCSYSFDNLSGQITFLTKIEIGEQTKYNLWYFKLGMDSSIALIKNELDSNFSLCGQMPFFNKDGTEIIFGRIKKEKSNNFIKMASIDIWNYRDEVLQSVQQGDDKKFKTYTSVVSVANHKIVPINQEYERVLTIGSEYALIVHELDNRGVYEAYWNKEAQFSYILVSLNDGRRRVLKDKVPSYDGGISISSNWKWAVYYDFSSNHLYSIDLKTFAHQNITKNISNNWVKTENAYPLPSLAGWVIWINEGKELLLSDNYDVWKIDPSGMNSPENVTNGFGRQHRIKFEVLNGGELSVDNAVALFKGFNKDTKVYGFYEKKINSKGDPQLLSKGPFVYGWWSGYGSVNFPPEKAKDAHIYMVVRMKSDQAPNYFITKDFKEFTQVSHLQPQMKFNWYTTELISWKANDGNLIQGILYKPQDFDSTKKYPLIFDYYERRSDELNLYIPPKPSDGRINIPLFVSNGYLVFAPDIYYRDKGPGISAYETVASAARQLSKFKWVDAQKMGLQGHSFGGYETNFIITHTNIFAAACSASGFCDLVSAYNSAARGGYPMYSAEKGQIRLGATPWQKADLYLKNSPIQFADKIQTPLLLMNNKNDYVVPFSQGVEFFVALRRLNKKVWMLQYDNGGHEVENLDAEDFHNRMIQFFDYFLKGKPAPKWMTKGIRASEKMKESGFETDAQEKELEPGLEINN
jgi:dipeptidyl aminopeptidase/acylaminoacyl peptidase